MTDSQVNLHDLAKLSPEARAALLSRIEEDLGPFMDTARGVVDAVRSEGDVALSRFAKRFDGVEIAPGAFRAQPSDFARAHNILSPEISESLDYAIENIRRFHERELPERMWLDEIRPGCFAGERWAPAPSVACYVPRGKGAFPSMTMMTLTPAVVAGVERVIVLTPPGADGHFDEATLVAADKLGIREIYRIGGAQAVAAAAYGTESVPKVAKIVGPGSPWVVAAKRLVAHVIDPGPPAGPTESIVLADANANPLVAALDLIIESEHGDDSSAYLVTDNADLAHAAIAAIPHYWAQMGAERAGCSSAVLCGPRGGVVVTRDFDDAVAFVNDYAPEHLQILTDEPMRHINAIVNAGEILLGDRTPSVLANFALGPNAVLPTSGAARTYSPLSVYDFMKRTGLGYVTSTGYPELAKHARRLALYEGFDGHANAVSETRERALEGRFPCAPPDSDAAN